MLPPIADRIAAELSVRPAQVTAAVELLDGGATVPFVARYRKEATGGLDDAQLRTLEERLGYLRELEERRGSILEAIDGQGKLTPALKASIEAAETKQRLEDLYLPYKVKRRTKAEIAREAGLEPLADALLASGSLDPEAAASAYLREPFQTEAGDNPGVPDTAAALEGARWIVMERLSEDAELLGRLRDYLREHGVLVSKVLDGKDQEGAKFRDYFEFAEPIAKVPPHRALALFRGRAADVLKVSLKLPEELESDGWRAEWGSAERLVARHAGLAERTDAWAQDAVRMTWRAKLAYSMETTLLADLRAVAEEEAIRVFARNLQDLLLAAPAGQRATMGLDPGIRTGVKVAVVDATGKLVDTATIYPFKPKQDVAGSLATLERLARRHGVELVAIGNGTASRETDALVGELKQRHPELKLHAVMINEAGASVYSASEFASREFPDLDVSLRGAVSIARRLQDPLAELVKIEPKSIGVGQYQHDVGQTKLARALDAVVEDCVNRVGVDVNTASAPLLARISGLSPSLAENVVALRDARGPFRDRRQLLDVPRLGPKAFEQAAGFLRIRDGDNPLDASAVHPEAYPVVERILADLAAPVTEVMKNPGKLNAANAERYVDDRFGLPTVRDILAELEKPGRDPRPEFRTAAFREGVNELTDLAPDMVLEGVVTNVTNFGAFVDVGVHQDGLVHISALADRFVKDPHEVVKAGDIVKVKVLEVDVDRRRIGLTMRLGDSAGQAREARPKTGEPQGRGGRRQRGGQGRGGARDRQGGTPAPRGAMAAALEEALGKRKR
ncbi:MAG: RNA-binding transcriptional accessory protein [Gammaproteobacteria bacterium]|nr:RNA-binding transcriptional accessory protein [Gammaproteobacteria bacterium]